MGTRTVAHAFHERRRGGARTAPRVAVALVAVAALAALLAGCDLKMAKAGTRCAKRGDYAQDGQYVMKCNNRNRWERGITVAQADAALAAWLAYMRRPAVGDVVRPATLGTPQLPNFADPSVLVEGGVTYVYGTSNYRRVPVIALGDLNNINPGETAQEAMATKPAWASTTEIWAPAVAKLGGRYVMFFAAHRISPPDPSNDQCVGRAYSASPLGPFSPEASPITCGNDGVHGALDPSVFIAPDGSAHLMVAMGGTTTNIWTFPIDGNGTIVGSGAALATRDQPWEVVFLENPSMYFDGSTYLLAYSVGNWRQEAYSTAVARCSTPRGPCTDRPDGPWLTTKADRWGPGGLSFFVGPDGQARVAFATYAPGNLSALGARSTTIRTFFTDPWPRLG